MNLDRWLAVAGLAIGVLGLISAFFSIRNERFANFLVRRRVREMPAGFRDMAKKYRLADEIPDIRPDQITISPSEKRVRHKDILAEGLGGFARGARLDRAALARGDDGYVAALMKVVAYEPRRSDVPLVIQTASAKVPPHTDYLTMAAISALVQKTLIGEDHRVAINRAINVIADRLGPNHKQRVEEVRAQVRKA